MRNVLTQFMALSAAAVGLSAAADAMPSESRNTQRAGRTGEAKAKRKKAKLKKIAKRKQRHK